MRHARCAAEPACAPIILRRTGLRPLRFSGRVLLQAEECAEPAWAWIRLAVYASDSGDIVTEILCMPGGRQAAWPWAQASRVTSLLAAAAVFEAAAPQAACDEAATPDNAVSLRCCIEWAYREAARAHAMRHAIGSFLHRLCTFE